MQAQWQWCSAVGRGGTCGSVCSYRRQRQTDSRMKLNAGPVAVVQCCWAWWWYVWVCLFVQETATGRQQDEAECRPSGSGAVLLGVVVRVGLFVRTGDSDRQQDEAECRPSGSGAVLLGVVVVRVGLFVHTGDSDRQAAG